MSEEQDLKITEQVMSDKTKLDYQPTVGEAWLILSAIQFATRVPALNGSMIMILEKVGRKYQRRIEALHPEAAQILEAGWDPEKDK
jgi:hypothetical protein